MRIEILASGSRGNCYAVHCSDGQVLLLDAGVKFQTIIAALEGLERIKAVLVTHEHMDHAACATKLMHLGVEVYMSQGTAKALGVGPFDRVRHVCDRSMQRIGCMSVLPFTTEHDAAEPLGFLIRDEGTGEVLLYATDTYFVRYRFPGVTHWLVECNYLDEMLAACSSKKLRERLRKSHMSLERLKELFAANDLSRARQIILCHLSDARSDEQRMVDEIRSLTGVPTIAADAGLIVEDGGDKS